MRNTSETRYLAPIVHIRTTIKKVDGVTTTYENNLLEGNSLMNELENLIKNGSDASVSIGINIGEKLYGNGIDVHCSISLKCSQEEERIYHACRLARGLAFEGAHLALLEARKKFIQPSYRPEVE